VIDNKKAFDFKMLDLLIEHKANVDEGMEKACSKMNKEIIYHLGKNIIQIKTINKNIHSIFLYFFKLRFKRS
jgi:hypothetical protein